MDENHCNIATSEEMVLKYDGAEVVEKNKEKTEYNNGNSVVVYGNAAQVKEMFKDWASYIGEIQNPDNNKNNPFFKSQYAPLDEVLNNARPILSKYGFGFFQSPTAEGKTVSVKTIITHKDGGSISFPSLTVVVAKDDPQSIIAGITYARRGSLNPILATHGEEDDDGNSSSNNHSSAKPEKTTSKVPSKATEVKLSESQKALSKLANDLYNDGVNEDLIKKTMGLNPRVEKDETKLKKALEELEKLKPEKTTKKVDLKEI